MKTSKVVLTLVAATAMGLVLPAETLAARQPGALQAKVEKGVPFKGNVEAVDPKARKLTVAGMVILVSDATKLTKKGNPIELKDIKVGDYVHGKTCENADGKTEAITIAVGGENE